MFSLDQFPLGPAWRWKRAEEGLHKAGAVARKKYSETTASVNSWLRTTSQSASSKYMLKLFLAALKWHNNTNDFVKLKQFQPDMNWGISP